MDMKQLYLAGGCFWGVEELFRNQKGVVSTRVGYTGGQTDNPTYETVCTGTTGHAEALEINYNSSLISLEELLHFFFSIHDPTTTDQQGNDKGSQYRSAIFFQSVEEKEKALEVIRSVEAQGFWKNPIVTQLEEFQKFYSAEDYHQDYLQKNPGGYTCHFKRY